MKKASIFISLICASSALLSLKSSASILAKLDLETLVQQKFLNVMRTVDPRSQVLVAVTFDAKNTSLPGLGLETQGFLSKENLEWEDVNEVKVTIHSSLDPFPESLNKVLREQVLPGVRRVQVTIEKTPADIAALNFESGQNLEKFMDTISTKVERLSTFFTYGLPSILGVFFLFALTKFFSSKKQASQTANSLAQAIRETRSTDDHPAARPQLASKPAESAIPSGTDGGGSKSLVQELTPESLIALISDSYWSELDGYAKFLWSHMSVEQRAYVVKAWPPAMSYAAYFSKFPADDLGFQHHPFYINPELRIDNVSNDDIAQWVKKEKSAWHRLSPIRKAYSTLSLLDRMECLNTVQKSTSSGPKESTQSTTRKFSADLQIHKISIDDERIILENPTAMLPHIEQIPSLVWLKMVDNSTLRTWLSKYSTQELAEVWSGPAEFLETLETLIPEKKLVRLKELQSKVAINRHSDVLAELTQQVKDHMILHNKIEDSAHEHEDVSNKSAA